MAFFADLIQLRPGAENLWAGEADTNYSHPAGQFGGWTAAVLLKAAMMEPGERGASAGADGDLHRRGRRRSHRNLDAAAACPAHGCNSGAAELSQRGKVCAHAQITFGVRRETSGFTDAAMPGHARRRMTLG